MSASETIDQTGSRSKKRFVILISGYLFFGLGLIGAVLPVLPSTVFWIIAAVCFARSSPKMYRRILNWPQVGSVVEDFVANGVINRRSKKVAISGMAVAAIIVALTPMGVTTTFASLAGIALGACYVLTRPSEPITVASEKSISADPLRINSPKQCSNTVPPNLWTQ